MATATTTLASTATSSTAMEIDLPTLDELFGEQPADEACGNGEGAIVDLLPPDNPPANKPLEKKSDWLNEQSQREAVLAAMRTIRAKADHHDEQARKLSPPGGQIAIGGAHFDEFLLGDSLAAFLRGLNRGMTPEAAETYAKTEARYAIRKWNEKRGGDYQTHRADIAADTAIETARRQIEEAAKPPAVEQSPAVVEADPIEVKEPPVSFDLDHANDLFKWQTDVVEAEHIVAESSLYVAKCQRELKSARDRHTSAVEDLEAIKAAKPEPAVKSIVRIDLSKRQEVTITSAPAVAPSNEWRAVATSELALGSIKGVGEKLLDEIEARCPTIGSLEDLRAEGSGKGIGLRSFKGVGEEKASAIEDRILQWLTENRDKAVFASAATEATETDQSSIPPADREAALIALAEQLAAGSLDSHAHDHAHTEGGEAFLQGKGTIHCPYRPDSSQAADWIRGFLLNQQTDNEDQEGGGR